MNWKSLILIILIFSGIISLIIINTTYENVSTSHKIGVTIFPFYDLVKEIVKDKYEVILIVPPGAEPHNYELAIDDVNKLRGVKIIFTSGTEIDRWADNIVKNLNNAQILSLNKDLRLIQNNDEIDPHYWLSLENMKIVAKNIEKEMENLDPQNKSFYQENLNQVLNKLDELLNFARNELKNIKNRYFITQHNAFAYFAQELNFEYDYFEDEHKEINPQKLQEITDKIIKLKKTNVIFKHPGEESKIIETLAKELKLKIAELDPLEGKGTNNFFEGYKNNIETLKNYLK